MYEWKFTAGDSADIAAIAAALHKLDARFDPDNDQIVMATEPAGYATSEEGPAIIRDIAEQLAEAGVTAPDFPDWKDLNHSQRNDLLAAAAGSLEWIEEGSFARSDIPVCEQPATQILYQIAGAPPPAPED